jgi:hypothetical protein
MNVFLKRFALGACFIVMMSAAIVSESPLRLGFFRNAEAIVRVIHPVATVAVVGAVSSSANASAAAAANANAAAASANAAAAASKPPPPAGPPPIGTIVTTLPPGCTTTVLNNVEYQRCGSTYYKASMMGSNLVFVVSQP